MCARITINKTKIHITTAYRPPSYKDSDDVIFYHMLNKTLSDKCIILGNYNVPNIEWNFVIGNNANSIKMIEFIDNYVLYQCVKEASREHYILDLVLTSHDSLVTDLEVSEHLSNSDHRIIRFDVNCSYTIETKEILVPDLKNADFYKLRQALNNTHGYNYE